MQHQMTNASGSTFPTEPLTTEQIQKLLDENKQLIMMIMENQNLGKLAECAQYQALLQKNLMYLAAIADAQPQAQAGLSQTQMQPAPQQGHFIQHPQPMMTQQQPNMFASKMPVQVNHQMQLIQPSMQQQQQQQFFPGHLGPRPVIQTPMHQMSPSGIVDPGSFSNALRSKQSYSGAFGGDIQGRQFGGEN